MKYFVIVLSLLGLVGCLEEPAPKKTEAFDSGCGSSLTVCNLNVAAKFVVATSSPDYQTSDVAVIIDTDSAQNVVIEQVVATTNPSDIRVVVAGNSVYRLGRYGFDNITKYRFDAAAQTLIYDYQYSVLGDDISANPYDIALLNETRGYLARANSTILWEINPSAANSTEFKTDEIDLSAFLHASTGASFVADLELVDTKLFVLMTQLNASWKSVEASTILVLDATRNSFIDTDQNVVGIQPIILPVKNAVDINRVGDTLYVSGTGDQSFGATDAEKYTGGIATVSTVDYTATLLLDDGDEADAPYGQISNVTATADNDVYFSGRISWGNDKFYVLEDGQSTATEISLGAGTYNIADIVTRDGNIYIAVGAQSDGSESAGLKVVSPDSNTVTDLIETLYNPTQVVVIE